MLNRFKKDTLVVSNSDEFVEQLEEGLLALPALQQKGLVRSLYNFSFKSFITPKLISFVFELPLVGSIVKARNIKLAYFLWIVGTLVALGAITAAISLKGSVSETTTENGEIIAERGPNEKAGVLFALIGAPILFVGSVVIGRATAEVVLVLEQIAKNNNVVAAALAEVHAKR